MGHERCCLSCHAPEQARTLQSEYFTEQAFVDAHKTFVDELDNICKTISARNDVLRANDASNTGDLKSLWGYTHFLGHSCSCTNELCGFKCSNFFTLIMRSVLFVHALPGDARPYHHIISVTRVPFVIDLAAALLVLPQMLSTLS
jgi:hypothetical protein